MHLNDIKIGIVPKLIISKIAAINREKYKKNNFLLSFSGKTDFIFLK